jgi:hypothetical protein
MDISTVDARLRRRGHDDLKQRIEQAFVDLCNLARALKHGPDFTPSIPGIWGAIQGMKDHLYECNQADYGEKAVEAFLCEFDARRQQANELFDGLADDSRFDAEIPF